MSRGLARNLARNFEGRTSFTGDCLDISRGVNSDRIYGNDFDDHWQLDRLPETMGRVTRDNEAAVFALLKDERAAAKMPAWRRRLIFSLMRRVGIYFKRA